MNKFIQDSLIFQEAKKAKKDSKIGRLKKMLGVKK